MALWRRAGMSIASTLLMAALALPAPVAAQVPKPASTPVIDLARASLVPSDLPEEGFGFAQGGPMDAFNLVTTLGGLDATPEQIAAVEEHMVDAHSQVLIRLSDPAERTSDPVSWFITVVIGADDEDGVAELRDALAQSDDPSTRFGDVTVTEDSDSVAAILSHRKYFIFNLHTADERYASRWVRDELAGLAELMADRIDDAVQASQDREDTLATANLWVSGGDAAWSRPTLFHPVTEHYRVLDGRTLPYAGEADAAGVNEAAPGIRDLFRSDQLVGTDTNGLGIAVTLGRFETAERAEAFATDPDAVAMNFSDDRDPVWSEPSPLDDETTIATGTREMRDRQATGYRTVRTSGDLVQIVEMLAWGDVELSEAGARNLTERQTACADAVPEPCDPVSRRELELILPGR